MLKVYYAPCEPGRAADDYTPNIAAYFERMKARPAFRTAAAYA